jgi:rRNA maturation RNase YbeY
MISFYTADITYSLKSRTDVRNWLCDVALAEKKKIDSLNIIFCSDEYLYRMNVDYLKHKTYTDIITFDHCTLGKSIRGELYISIDRIRDNAGSLHVTIKDELHRVMVHGLLHLCGYSDKHGVAKKEMTFKEDFYLGKRRF